MSIHIFTHTHSKTDINTYTQKKTHSNKTNTNTPKLTNTNTPNLTNTNIIKHLSDKHTSKQTITHADSPKNVGTY